MDNDDLRRGRATVHKKFDEATALLVGDTLFCDAAALLAGSLPTRWQPSEAQELSGAQRLAMLQVLTRSGGSSGIVLGQVQDLLHTGNRSGSVSQEEVVETYRKKTGSLIGAACAMGAIAAHASPEVVEGFLTFGELLGTAFQIVDDLLDDSSASGKTPGKDRSQDKKNLISVLEPDAARQLAGSYTQEALAQLPRYCDTYALSLLRQFAESLLYRTH
jgi:geranylgeranyl pyrophosphate synthase